MQRTRYKAVLCVSRLLLFPGALAPAAISTSNVAAVGVGVVASGLAVGFAMAAPETIGAEPFPSLAEYFRLFAMMSVVAGIVLAVPIGVVAGCVGLPALALVSVPHRRAIGRALFLIPVLTLVPTVAWSVVVMLTYARNPADFTRVPPPAWIRSPAIDALAHPASLAAIGAYGLGALSFAAQKIRRHPDWTPEPCCPHCGYSRAGLRSACCPECGQAACG